MESLESKEFLIKEINKNLEFIFSNINFETGKINIHINKNIGDDYTRMMFILFTISRVLKNDIKLLENIEKQTLLKLFNEIFAEAKTKIDFELFRYLELYGMRFLNNLGEDYSICINSFKQNNYASLFVYPVTTYVFLSAYFECEKLKNEYPFSESLKNSTVSNFDFLIFGNRKNSWRAFYFSEISAWKKFIPEYLYDEGLKTTEDFFKRDLKDRNSYSSGIAKCLEHFARVGDMENFSAGIKFLETRKLSNYKNYLNPKFYPFQDYVFTETDDSQYICLDTSAHLINAYLNIYEKLP